MESVNREKSRFDLDGYLRRIGWRGDLSADVATLQSVHRAHALSIPFENADVFLFREVPSLALPDIQEKLVRARRGGLCYEHNILFAAALREIGFTVTYLTGRVLAQVGMTMPRTHLLMAVDVPGEGTPYIADVGFGLHPGLIEAIALVEGVESVQDGRWFRVDRRSHRGPGDLWVLQAQQTGEWKDQYAFTLEPFEEIDIGVINWAMTTNPRSPALHRLYVGIPRTNGHLAVVGGTRVECTPDGRRTERELEGPQDVRRVLADEFGIELPDVLATPTTSTSPAI